MRQLTVNEGLPQGQVRGMVQDRQGFIWLATEGLSRYDGRSFLNYSNVFGDTNSLADNDIRSLEIDNADNLWMVYATKEVDVMNAASGHVRHISAEPAFRWLKELSSSSRISIRQAGNCLFTVNSDQLTAFDITTGRHQTIPHPAGEKVLALSGNIPAKALMATTKALYEIQGDSLKPVLRFPSFSNDVYGIWNSTLTGADIVIGRILEYSNGNLAITAVGGMFVYERHDKHCYYYGDEKDQRIIYSPVLAADGHIYYNLNAGIYRLSGNQPPELIFKNLPPLALNGSLLADRSGMLWASAYVLGIRMFDLRPVNFYSFPQKRGFAIDVLQQWLPGPAANMDYASYELRSAKDTGGNIWMMNHMYQLEGKQKANSSSRELYQFTGNRLQKERLPDTINEIRYCTFDHNNRFWRVSQNKVLGKRVLVKTNLQLQTVTPVVELPDGWKENGYLTAIANRIGYLTDDELRLYDTATAACTVYSKAMLNIGGSLLMAVPDRQQKNILWIATKGSGIVKLNITTGAIQHYTEANGLPNNTVYFMAPDKKGFFWCSSNKGLFRFNPADGSVVAFTVKDGLQGNEFNRYHFLETPDGHFYFGGTEGYTCFHPDSVYLDNYQTPVAITGLQVNNIPLQQLGDRWKDSTASNLSSIILSYNQNQLSFSFAGLQYNAPEKLQYRYQLQGIDKNWIHAGYNANASYASIPPGRYVLKVNASNTSGRWSNYVKTLSITILPPWWRTWWMYTIYGLLLAGAVYFFISIRLRRLQLTQQVQLKQREAEQAQVLEETKSRLFANITHELRTPLTLILSPVQKQLQEGSATYSPQLLKGVYHNSQILLRLINQLLDMSKLEGGSMPVTLSRGHIVPFIDSLMNPFRQQAAARDIHFIYQPDVFSEEYLFDADKLEKIIHNLLSNAFKFTPDGGQIQVVVSRQSTIDSKTTFQIQVSDSGIGIPAENLPHIFDRFYQVNASTTRKYEGTGIGLSLVKEFIELMGGEIKAASTEGKGSVFTISLPLAPVGEQDAATPLVVNLPAAVQEVPAVAGANNEENAIADTKKPLVLITEDNTSLRQFIAECLQPYYRVMTAVNGEAGLQTAITELPELIISDVMMPVMDGYEFCQKIKEHPLTSHIGFIMLTAKMADESRVSGLQLGADYHIGKPFIVEELMLVISNLLKRQQQLRELYSKQLQQPAEKLPVVQEVEDPFLQSVYAVIENHLDSDQLDVDFLASEMAVSRRTLNRRLATVADTSANELIRNYRLKKAAGLLLQGEAVSSAAYATGFSTPSYFSQCFKEMYGLSPVQWAENGDMSQN